MTSPEKICDYVIHPAASVFPLMEGAAFQSLVDSIAVHGVQNPLVSFKGEVLDGRNRLRAVMKLRDDGHKVDLPCVEWTSPNGMTVTEWIEVQNLDRRHLSDDQRVAIAAALQPMIDAEARESQKASRFKSDTAKAAAARRHDKAATVDSPSPQKRDWKKSEARTTASKLAKRTKTSTHKAKQAISLNKAVQSGAVSPEVQQAVMAGKKKLKDAVPALPKPDKSKRTHQSIDDEIQFEINKAWSKLRGKFAPGAEHKKLRVAMIALVRKEQKTFEK
jgi:ParB-like chromosome segregation protein Spo0J